MQSKTLFLRIVLSACVLSLISGIEAKENQKDASVDSICPIADVELLNGFASIKVLLEIPQTAPGASKTMHTQAARELKGFGKVITKNFSPEEAMKDQQLLKSPFLIYRIKEITDMNGKKLPLIQASLAFEAFVTVEGNKEFGSAILWNGESYIQRDPDQGKVFSQTFPVLLKQFEDNYMKSNHPKSENLTFYLFE